MLRDFLSFCAKLCDHSGETVGNARCRNGWRRRCDCRCKWRGRSRLTAGKLPVPGHETFCSIQHELGKFVYGVADKVLAMALSSLLLGAGNQRPLWVEVGATFVAIDTLVHNFLHRTGILQRFCAEHPYGDRCYRPGGCASILGLLAANIDAREFNPTFPATFPRFVQSAIWRYCVSEWANDRLAKGSEPVRGLDIHRPQLVINPAHEIVIGDVPHEQEQAVRHLVEAAVPQRVAGQGAGLDLAGLRTRARPLVVPAIVEPPVPAKLRACWVSRQRFGNLRPAGTAVLGYVPRGDGIGDPLKA
jgi:hypothetical protein